MTPEQFTYWLQGFLEIQNPSTLDERQITIVKDHLQLVFKKETPDRDLKKKLNPIDSDKDQQSIVNPLDDWNTRLCSNVTPGFVC
mgnify:CR=1 FL=1